MLEDFVTAEVRDYCECNEIKLTDKQMKEVVKNVINNDEWYDILTSNIQCELYEMEAK